jgi:hypothetical protein
MCHNYADLVTITAALGAAAIDSLKYSPSGIEINAEVPAATVDKVAYCASRSTAELCTTTASELGLSTVIDGGTALGSGLIKYALVVNGVTSVESAIVPPAPRHIDLVASPAL